MLKYKLELNKPQLTTLYHNLMDTKTRINRYIKNTHSNPTASFWMLQREKINTLLDKVNIIKDYSLKEKLYNEI